MKRKNKRLGSPPEEHFMQATNLADMASESLKRANQHMSNRDCGAVASQLKNAAINIGAGLSDLHAAGGGWGTKQVKNVLLTEKKRLNQMTERFKSACLKTPKEVKAGARAKRRNR